MKKAGTAFLVIIGVLFLASFAGAQGMGMMDDDDMQMMGSGTGMGPGTGCGTGCGMGWGSDACGMTGGGMGMSGMRAFAMLDLTAEQRTKINKVRDDLRKEHWALMGKMMDERTKLHDLYDEEKPDAKKIGAVSDAIHALQKQMLESRIDAYNRMRDLLTKEQREELSRMRRGGMGWRGGRHGMMGQ